MADNKKYYYIRLKESYFDSDEIKMLESIPNDGYKFSNILLKMYLKSLKYDGRLMFKDGIPFSAEMLSVVTGHSLGDIHQAIELFKKFGLIEVFDSGEIYMLDIQTMIGKTSTEADRKREYRKEIEEKRAVGTNVRQNSDKSIPEIELEKEIEIDKEINTPKPPEGDSKKSRKSKSGKITEKEKADFEALWKLYPRKRGKNIAEKAYLKAIRDGVTNKTIQDGIIAYCKQIKAEGKSMEYVSYGSTFFNQRMWDDDFTPAIPTQRNGKSVKQEPPMAKNVAPDSDEYVDQQAIKETLEKMKQYKTHD